MEEINQDVLVGVTGGNVLRDAYRGAVKNVTAAIGGWKLADQMYGTKEHGASWSERWRARGAFMDYLNGSDRLPSWAPPW